MMAIVGSYCAVHSSEQESCHHQLEEQLVHDDAPGREYSPTCICVDVFDECDVCALCAVFDVFDVCEVYEVCEVCDVC